MLLVFNTVLSMYEINDIYIMNYKNCRTCNYVVHVHGRVVRGGGGAVISSTGWRECSGIIEGGGVSSENILRREFDVLEGDYK